MSFTVVGDNKILTVSYGTFSCTLEGFDDPFSTMKNIAEYFRDLAAGDRFFGAEPPQPDPEMLQSIAEQTIQARVNAQLSDTNNLVLRQTETVGSSPSLGDSQPPLSSAADVAPVAAVVAAAVVAPQVAPVAAAGFETVAEKLQRIRAVVSREAAQDALFSEDQHVDEFSSETATPVSAFDDSAYEDTAFKASGFEDMPDTAPSTPVVEPVIEPVVEPVVEPVAEEATPVVADEAVAEEVIEEATADVAQDAADEINVVEEEVSSSDVTADTSQFDEEEADALEDIDLSSFKSASSDDDYHENEVSSDDTDESAPETETSTSTSHNELDAKSLEDAAETAVDNVLGRTSEDADVADATPRRRIVVQKITRDDLKAAREEAALIAASKDKTADITETETAALSDLPADQEEDLLRELAALQTNDTAAEMTFENDPVLNISDEDEKDVDFTVSDEETDEVVSDDDLSDDAISEDADANDALASALNDLVSEDEREKEKDEQEAARLARRERRDAIIEEDAGDVERLISATTLRIENDESSQRRASIAHLKAAVAATKADSSLTEAAQEHEARERDQYAEDLARVVRPERTTPRVIERSTTDRPAPLVLVSELRIDNDDEELEDAVEVDTNDDGPVTPHMVDRTQQDAQDAEAVEDEKTFSDPDQSSFAAYAESANALDLPDLLEAAAAYYTYVESTEQFTRPMLMRKIASISSSEGFSREAGLRSFGTLLREGKLVKDGNGKFVIAKSSRFTPEARYAGE